MTETDSILDDLFHGCALRAYVDEAAAVKGWPDPEATRLRAYRYYEEALAEKHRLKTGSGEALAETIGQLQPTPIAKPG